MAGTYRAQIDVKLWDEEGGHAEACVNSRVDILFPTPDDPRSSLTLAALKAAVFALRTNLPYMGFGRE